MTTNVSERKVRADSAPVSPRKFAHAVFMTAKYDEMIAWYKTVLNAEVMAGNPMLTFMTFDDEHHRLAFVNQPKLTPKDGTQTGVEHMAYTLGDLGELLNTYARLKAEGILPAWCVNHGLTISMYYQDPEGTRIELQVDNFDTPDKLKAWFKTPEFAANPIGMEYDPDELVAKYESGASEAELIRIGFEATA